MPNPMIRIHNTKTDEVIDREMTDEEFEIHKERIRIHQEWERNFQEQQNRRAEILERLGLSEDEAKLIFG